MKKTLMLFAVIFSLAAVTVAAGCAKCNAGEQGTENAKAATGSCPEGTVKTAVTPEGDLVYIVAIWSAGESCTPPGESCKTAQCWKDQSGKTWCAKPLAVCPKKGNNCPAKEHYQKQDKTVQCVPNDPAVAADSKQKEWVVKQVAKCPAKGSSDCPAPTHVNGENQEKACAKADVKQQEMKKTMPAAASEPPMMENGVEEDTYFVVSTF